MYRQPTARANPSCLRRLGCLTGALAAVLLTLIAGGLVFAAVVDAIVPGVFALNGVPVTSRAEAIGSVAIAELGEDPHLTPRQPSGALPLCDDVPPVYGHAFRLAFGLMRGTAEGSRLYALLIDHDICIGVTDLPYNTAYSSARHLGDDWSGSTIMVDRRFVRSLDADVLAAILVHEATHLDRAITGQACYLKRSNGSGDACTRLPNGVEVEEEVAAHSAEAEWWLAAYGDDGKRFAWRSDYSENRLLAAYVRGPSSFHAYVSSMRSDAREGEGI
ncbi:MAG TPA: hypothetical protein VH482_14000 [Thermomicrobiales bacterium]